MTISRNLVIDVLNSILDLSLQNAPATRSKILQNRRLSSSVCTSDKNDYEQFKSLLRRLIAEGFVQHEVKKVSGIERDTYQLTMKGKEVIFSTGMSREEWEMRAARNQSPAKHQVEKATTHGTPHCPQCGHATTRKNGQHGPFYGCLRFPVCKGSVPAGQPQAAAKNPAPDAPPAQPADATAALLAKLVDTVADLSRAVSGLRGQLMQKTVTDAETIGCLRAEVKHLRSKLAYLRLPGLN